MGTTTASHTSDDWRTDPDQSPPEEHNAGHAPGLRFDVSREDVVQHVSFTGANSASTRSSDSLESVRAPFSVDSVGASSSTSSYLSSSSSPRDMGVSGFALERMLAEARIDAPYWKGQLVKERRKEHFARVAVILGDVQTAFNKAAPRR
ncbi:uncharacterized protein Z518_03973 [Rhinocladiella mackenziei CBS 650.93]|uniref:Uncharacterized protein n=1 Tax=Rhinocladiella mackenziei CBS 650.93 TaxID=1442369 RepID=A0A0D2IJZ5_9EURO|nr:uncharacterized protein Z518_03973 [Rhinocladiella mackenziei CBS 650.93]KIX05999.1 hypothetical protein Z518_03973 [Rhinocladiella mackenziei CBS 650.93]